MSSPVIHVENLGKRYKIGEHERYLALRDIIARAVSAPLRLFRGRNRSSSNGDPTHIWALKDVSFDVRQGEVVGIIGRNGAGKTTLLKLLARVAKPTAGFADIRGRMGSLLEVGTGFHPELTGRENTFLSGAILGMRKAEILRKFDEIVAFAEVEKFIDTPVKHYSTGMQTRLAFAVAAHLEPEILLVDEVLSVGDMQFQKKCLGKMGDVAKQGRTILFVSHQMNQIRRLCGRALWVVSGQIGAEGPAGEVVSAYESEVIDPSERNGENDRCFLSWEIPEQGNVLRDGLRQLTLDFRLNLHKPISRGHFGLNVYDGSNLLIAGWGFDDLNIPEGLQQLAFTVPLLPLRPGIYVIQCSLFDNGNNLTGGHLVESWFAARPLIVDTIPLSHPQDRWVGLLNIPGSLQAGTTSKVAPGTVQVEKA